MGNRRPAEMAADLAKSLSALHLDADPEAREESSEEGLLVQMKVAGQNAFEVEAEPALAIRDLKKLASEQANIQPKHMRLIHKDRLLKDAEILSECKLEQGELIQIHYTAGHTAMMGGARVKLQNQQDPFHLPVRGLPGSKGQRLSRISARHGGMGLIRKYGIMLKRQEFREKAEEIGFVKYR